MRLWRCGRGPVLIGAVCLLIGAGAPAAGQPVRPGPSPAATPGVSTGVPNALQGFSQNRDEPVHITSRRLEVRDKDKIATFLGDVHVTQGDTNMTCQTLVVYYEQSAATGTAPTTLTPQPGGQQQVRRLLAQGDVVVTQCQNVVHGDRLTVDLTTGVSHIEAGKSSHGRVEGLFVPGQQSHPSDT